MAGAADVQRGRHVDHLHLFGQTCPTLRGEDAIEALIGALQLADFRLRQLARIHGGVFTLDRSAELRDPSTITVGDG